MTANKYDLDEIRERMKRSCSISNLTVLPSNPKPEHLRLAEEIKQDLGSSWRIEGTMDSCCAGDWGDQGLLVPPSCRNPDEWAQCFEGYSFLQVMRWSQNPELFYGSEGSPCTIYLRFCNESIHYNASFKKEHDYADPQFFDDVSSFVARHRQHQPKSKSRLKHDPVTIRNRLRTWMSRPQFGAKPISANLADKFAQQVGECAVQHEGYCVHLVTQERIDVDVTGSKNARIQEHQLEMAPEFVKRWGHFSFVTQRTDGDLLTLEFSDRHTKCYCFAEYSGSFRTDRGNVARILNGWGFSLAVHRHGDSSLFYGDCRGIMSAVREAPSLIFADPPFNIGHGYEDFEDNLSEAEYRQFTHEWILAAEDCLADDGVMAIHVPDELVPLVLETASLPRISWIIWHYRFGQCHRSNWINGKAHCLVFAKNPDKYTWNPDEVLVASDRATTYKDKRTQNSATPGQRVPFDVWGIPSDGPYWGRGQGNNRERRAGHPNQLPEVYLERLIRAYTNPGDLVLDPFVGSGTTVVVAEALGRRSIGIDVSHPNIDSAFERLKSGAVRVQA
jgi:site-specific DNA-methyltransferase (adenine-specific)